MGDGVLLYFGYPRAQEDDPERAVRAALLLIDRIATLETVAGRLHIRVGIATGLVVVGELIGSGEAQERGVVGETPNLAARLQAMAEPNTVLISDSTRRLAGNFFEYRAFNAIKIKGIDCAVRVWQVLQRSNVQSRFKALHSAEFTPLVGRLQEIEFLERHWLQARTGNGRVVFVSGEPGIGKSRLVTEFEERLRHEKYHRIHYFCSPHHRDSALHPIIAQLEHAAGFRHDDIAAEKLSRLKRLLLKASPIEPDVSLIADLLNIRDAAVELPAVLSPQSKKNMLIAALLRQLEGVIRGQPVLLLFEDLHWIDPTSRELLELIIDRAQRLPVLLIATFRPEFQSSWMDRPHATAITLPRLDKKKSITFVSTLARKRSPLWDNVIDEIVERADGVPLFLEELTKAVIEQARGEDWKIYGLGRTLELSRVVPGTLYGSLMARLDRLGVLAKDVAQNAAVIGREFSFALLSAIVDFNTPELVGALRSLVNAGLLFQRGRIPDANFEFKHSLVQDVACQSLLRPARQKVHERVGRALAMDAQIAETQPELIAYHLINGGQSLEAITYWQRAGNRATQRSTNAEAVTILQRAVKLLRELPPFEGQERQEFSLLVDLLPPLIASKGYSSSETDEAISRALKLTQSAGEPAQLYPLLYANYAYFNVRGEIRKAGIVSERVRFLSKMHPVIEAAPLADRLVGVTAFLGGNPRRGRRLIERALARYDFETHSKSATVFGQDHRVAAQGYLCLALWVLGFVELSREHNKDALAYARKLDHANTLGVALTYSGALLHALYGDADAVHGFAEELSALGSQRGLPLWSAVGVYFQGQALAAQSSLPEGIAKMSAGLDALKDLQVRLFRPIFLAWIAAAWGRGGKFECGTAALGEAKDVMETGGECWLMAEVLRMEGELYGVQPGYEAQCEENLQASAPGRPTTAGTLVGTAFGYQLGPALEAPRSSRSLLSTFAQYLWSIAGPVRIRGSLRRPVVPGRSDARIRRTRLL